ncbi:MAG TPA: hypothetical protein VG146_16445 [Verrucomicrobiae bacterium]|nr:hypothetical protein [Verrucomicrobiae bacterium]
MKESIASAPAETWNQKNLHSDIEQFEQSPRDAIKHLPSATMGLARRRPGVFILALIGILGLVWYFTKRD